MALKQSKGVSDYIERFELLSATLSSCDEEMLVAAFLNGLHVDIKADLRLLRLSSLSENMDMALRLEERNQVKMGAHGPRTFGPNRSWHENRSWADQRPNPSTFQPRYTQGGGNPSVVTHNPSPNSDPKKP